MTTKQPDLIYWDSCVFIDCLQKTPGRFAVLDAIVEAAKRREVKIVTSMFTIAEVVGLSDVKPVSAADAAKIKAFFENDFIAMRQVDRAIVEDAADIGRHHSIRPPDAVHIATALRWKCRVLQTYDGVNEPKKKKRMLFYDGKIGVPPLPIKVPTPPEPPTGQKNMFDDFGESSDAGPASKEQAPATFQKHWRINWPLVAVPARQARFVRKRYDRPRPRCCRETSSARPDGRR